jgi:hypothetical protein
MSRVNRVDDSEIEFMPHDYDHPEEVRSPVEIAHFALAFVGFVTGAIGIVIQVGAIAVCGAVLMLLAFAFFAINSK